MSRGANSKKKTQPAPVAAVAVAGSPKKLSNAKSSVQCSDNRTATEQQHLVMLQALRRRPQTTADFRALGVLQPSARVFGLRAKKFVIETTRIVMADHVGVLHSNAALYTLIAEPEGAA